jgi:hypothetical protein
MLMQDGATESAKRTKQTTLQAVGIGGGCLALGSLLATAAAVCGLLPRLFGVELVSGSWLASLAGAGVLLLTVGWSYFSRAMRELPDPEQLPEPRRSCVLYGRHLGGIGVALLVDASFTITLFVALARIVAADGFTPPAAAAPAVGDGVGDSVIVRFEAIFGSSAAEANFVSVMLILSTFVALLGALFFFATSIWQKMDDPSREPFDRSLFWAGLWFRIGEALVFNLVLFLVLRAYVPEQFLILPLMALLVGMFLKSGEQLITGLANRLFAAFTELLPSKPAEREVLRMVELPLKSAFASGTLTSTGEKLVASIEKVRGVTRVVADAQGGVLRAEFDALVTSGDRITHEVRLHGLTQAPQPPPGATPSAATPS